MKRNADQLQTMDQVREFVAGGYTSEPQIRSRLDAYRFIMQTVQRFDYFLLPRVDKGVLRRFLVRASGLSRAQIHRLLEQYRTTGQLKDHRGTPLRPFPRRYTDKDIELISEVDILHGSLAPAVARTLYGRAYHLFADGRFERVAHISNGHLYNLRRSAVYRQYRRTRLNPSLPVLQVVAGKRWRPRPFEEPGHIRVACVRARHDIDGLYYLVFADEVTRFRFVSTLNDLQESSLAPALTGLLHACPFRVHELHADGGSDAVTLDVVAVLHKLHRDEISGRGTRFCNTSARARRGGGGVNDAVTARINAYAQRLLSPYLNYHRLYIFCSHAFHAEGSATTQNPHDTYVMTPYDRLKSLPRADTYLLPGRTFTELDAIACAVSDNEAAHRLMDASMRLFDAVHPTPAASAP